nr:cysteine proteinases superfamily protein [Tanacetum cinerariifolium]
MEEIFAKFIDEGKHEHEEMEVFIKEFRTTNELLFKEQSNLLSELKIKVNKLSKVMGNVLIPKNKVKGGTIRGEKMTSEATPGDDEVIFDMDQSNIETKDKNEAENLAIDHLSSLENLHMKVFTEREIANKFHDEHLMLLKSKFNDDEPRTVEHLSSIVVVHASSSLDLFAVNALDIYCILAFALRLR